MTCRATLRAAMPIRVAGTNRLAASVTAFSLAARCGRCRASQSRNPDGMSQVKASARLKLDEVEAAALVGAFVGAVGGALEVLLRDGHADPDVLRERLRRATAVALRPWA